MDVHTDGYLPQQSNWTSCVFNESCDRDRWSSDKVELAFMQISRDNDMIFIYFVTYVICIFIKYILKCALHIYYY